MDQQEQNGKIAFRSRKSKMPLAGRLWFARGGYAKLT
jgi:hypothetical protein